MTTGDPVVVRVAMKPLPTLTKPLRSVDTETKQPAAGTARAHRLLHRAGGGRGRGGDGRARARRAPTARSSAATPWSTCWRRSTPTGSGSNGGGRRAAGASGRTRGAIGPVAKIVFVGFMGAGKSTAARGSAARLGHGGARRRRGCSRSVSASRSRLLRARGRGRLPRARARRWCSSSSSAPGPRCVALGGGAVESQAVREALRSTSRHLDVDVDPARLDRARGLGPPAGARPRARSSSCTPGAPRCTSPSRARGSSGPTPRRPPGVQRRGGAGPAAALVAALRRPRLHGRRRAGARASRRGASAGAPLAGVELADGRSSRPVSRASRMPRPSACFEPSQRPGHAAHGRDRGARGRRGG